MADPIPTEKKKRSKTKKETKKKKKSKKMVSVDELKPKSSVRLSDMTHGDA